MFITAGLSTAGVLGDNEPRTGEEKGEIAKGGLHWFRNDCRDHIRRIGLHRSCAAYRSGHLERDRNHLASPIEVL